ncbi:Ankyrin repeat domain-containing protein [Plasmodiophora brassicae]
MRTRISYRTVIIAIGIAGIGGALTFDAGGDAAGDHVVNTSAATVQSGVLKAMVDDLGERGVDVDVPVPLPAIARPELEFIAQFISMSAVHEVDRVAAWVRVRLDRHWPSTEAQCRLLAAAHYLEMRPLTTTIMSTKRTWQQVAALRDLLPADAFWFALDHSVGVHRLRRAARTDPGRCVAGQVARLVVYGGNPSVINGTPWDSTGNALHWAVSDGDELVVELLLHVAGIDVNARDPITYRTPLHYAARRGYARITALLLSVPGVDVNARARDDARRTPLHEAALRGHRHIVRLLTNATGIEADARDAYQATPADLLALTFERVLAHHRHTAAW